MKNLFLMALILKIVFIQYLDQYAGLSYPSVRTGTVLGVCNGGYVVKDDGDEGEREVLQSCVIRTQWIEEIGQP